ncbi:MAG: ABC transporter ATP-binding protein, partial [Oscillospiraceae bacterium]
DGLVAKIMGTGGINFDAIGSILLFLLTLYIISSALSFVQGYIMSGVSQKIAYQMRDEISQKIHKMPMKYFESKTVGEVLSRVTNDVDTLSMNLNQSLTQIITSITTVIGVLVMMFSINWVMTLATLLILPISMIFVMVVVKRSQKYFKQQQEYLGHINGQIEETYSGHNVVKVFNGEEKVTKVFDETNETLYKSAWKSQFISGMMMPIMNFIGNIGYVVISILGGYLTIKGFIKVGDIVSFTQYIRSFNQPIAQAAQVMNMLQSTAAAAERVFEFLSENEEDQIVENSVKINNLKGNVQFKNVEFGYNPEKIIINNFSANIKEGQKVAIVGPTGAGKTTMIKLLMRFYDVNNGEILIDENNIKNFNRSELREMFGMVLQDTWLFSGTILENIRYGRLNATEEEVIEAAKAAHVHHFIKTLPGGYNMVLNEETSNISQGQKQLLTIARAI